MTAAETTPGPELTIVTGMSGAGRSTAARVLEDLGWFVVDNLPPGLLGPMVELAGHTQGAIRRVAAVVDVRGRSFFADLRDSIDQLSALAVDPRIVFLEASDDVLVRRFEGVRRKHPLQDDGRIVDGIARERLLLGDLREEADLVIDTSGMNVHELRIQIEHAFGDEDRLPLQATVVSFGFKYGLPVDADLVVDVRFLPNPHWVPELRPQTGLDPDVAQYVTGSPDAQELLARYGGVLHLVIPGYIREGKRYVTLAVGCTGGKHRSVAMAELLGAQLVAEGVDTHVVHRDLGRE
jgi:UPF0042 nucleotide-binding protein